MASRTSHWYKFLNSKSHKATFPPLALTSLIPTSRLLQHVRVFYGLFMQCRSAIWKALFLSIQSASVLLGLRTRLWNPS